jgi:hypothetical protein
MNTPSYFCIDNFNDSLPVFSKTIISCPGELKIYPNPVKDIFYAGVPNDAKEIIIVSSDGRVIVRKEIYDQRVVRISDLSGLPSGTYLLHVKTRDTILTGKLMKL